MIVASLLLPSAQCLGEGAKNECCNSMMEYELEEEQRHYVMVPSLLKVMPQKVHRPHEDKEAKKTAVSFVSQLEIHSTIHVNDMTTDEKRSTWYSKEELNQIRFECNEIAKGRCFKSCTSRDQNSNNCDETVVDRDNDCEQDVADRNGLEVRTVSLFQYQQQRWIQTHSIDAVLSTQCDQWHEMMTNENKSSYDDTDSSTFTNKDDEAVSTSTAINKIANVYSKYSIPCQQAAHNWGLYDEMVASII